MKQKKVEAKASNVKVLGSVDPCETVEEGRSFWLPIDAPRSADAWHAAVARAVEKLSRPGIADLMTQEAARREDNLDVQYHVSKARTEHIADHTKRGQFGQAARQGPGGYAGGAPPGTAGGYPENVAGTKGASAPERLRRYPGSPKNIYTIRIYARNWRSASVDVEATTPKKAMKVVCSSFPVTAPIRSSASKSLRSSRVISLGCSLAMRLRRLR